LALWELYTHCGYLDVIKKISPLLFPFKRLEIACSSYYGKLSQLLELSSVLPPDKLLIVNYEDLLEKGEDVLPIIFKFINLEYDPSCTLKLNKTSKDPINNILKLKIERYCRSIYEEVKLLSILNLK